jgi:hypothetical protein
MLSSPEKFLNVSDLDERLAGDCFHFDEAGASG